MLKKKKIEVRVVEDAGSNEAPVVNNYNGGSAGYVHDTIVEAASIAVVGVCAYLAGDTLRRCIVHVVAVKFK